MNKFAAEFKTFALTTVEKYQQLSHMGPWSTAYDAEELAFCNAVKENLR